MGMPHGIFNKSDHTAKCLFWVTPTRKLYDLFWGIHSMKEQKPDEVVALSAKHEVIFLPPPPERDRLTAKGDAPSLDGGGPRRMGKPVPPHAACRRRRARRPTASAQHNHMPHQHGQFERLNQPGRIEPAGPALPACGARQPGAEGRGPGKLVGEAPLPIPAHGDGLGSLSPRDRMHLVGGYAEQRVDKPYHHAYDRRPTLGGAPRNSEKARTMLASSHTAICSTLSAASSSRTARRMTAPSSSTEGLEVAEAPAGGLRRHRLRVGGRPHPPRGRSHRLRQTAAPLTWHLTYDPKSDSYGRRQPMPLGRDHTGIVVVNGRIHVVGGRVDSFHTNSTCTTPTIRRRTSGRC